MRDHKEQAQQFFVKQQPESDDDLQRSQEVINMNYKARESGQQKF